MRPTCLGFRNPKDRTPEFCAPAVPPTLRLRSPQTVVGSTELRHPSKREHGLAVALASPLLSVLATTRQVAL